jgi:hypothetical protein
MYYIPERLFCGTSPAGSPIIIHLEGNHGPVCIIAFEMVQGQYIASPDPYGLPAPADGDLPDPARVCFQRRFIFHKPYLN